MTRLIAAILIALGFYNAISIGMQYATLRTLQAENAYVPQPSDAHRATMLAIRQKSLLSPWNDLGMMRASYMSPDALGAKLELNTALLRTWPSADNAFRQAVLLAIAGREAEAKAMWLVAAHAYPDSRNEVVKVVVKMRDGLPQIGGFIDWASK